jgi:ribonuclease Z
VPQDRKTGLPDGVGPIWNARQSDRQPGGEDVKLTLLGTGTPIPNVQRYGPSQVIEVGAGLILVDAGVGVVHRLLEAGYARPKIQRIGLTHLHFDHIAGLHDLLWAGWIQGWWDVPPPIVGPAGTREFIAGLMQAFSYDIKVRTMGERRREDLIPADIDEMEDGWATESGDWRLSAFRVEHHPVDQAFGFRLDSNDGSMVISGDTHRSENLIRHSRGVHLLLHEVYWAEGMRRAIEGATSSGVRARLNIIAGYHTPSNEVGEIADSCHTERLVLSHLIFQGGSPADIRNDAERQFRGPIGVGEDLQVYEVTNRR